MVSRQVPVCLTGLRKGTESHSSLYTAKVQEAANVWKDNVLQMIEETSAKDIFNVYNLKHQ